MASGDSGDSPSNAAIAAMGGGNGQEAIACGDGFPVQLGNGEGVWGGDGQEIFLCRHSAAWAYASVSA